MTGEKLYEIVGEIADQHVRAAEEDGTANRRVWKKWIAAAACLCLAAGLLFGLPAAQERPQHSEDPLPQTVVLEYGGAYYEVTDDPAVLKKYGLPQKPGPDMAGERLAWLRSDGGSGYICAEEETGAALYRYMPADCGGVYLLRDGERWYAALFCNFLLTDPGESRGLDALYRIYGVESAAEIVCAAEVDWDRNGVCGKTVTDARELVEFYGATVSLEAYSSDAFQQQVFAGVPESEAAKAHTAFADDLRVLRVETADGLYFYLSFYPGHGWVGGDGTLSFCRMTDVLESWFDRHFG